MKPKSTPTSELARLREQIAIGIAELDRGESVPWDADEIAAEVERRFCERLSGVTKGNGPLTPPQT